MSERPPRRRAADILGRHGPAVIPPEIDPRPEAAVRRPAAGIGDAPVAGPGRWGGRRLMASASSQAPRLAVDIGRHLHRRGGRAWR